VNEVGREWGKDGLIAGEQKKTRSRGKIVIIYIL
jgi:hypothetical protein